MAKRTLNNKLIDALPRPKRGRRSVFDKKVPGLHVRYTASGLKTFSLLYRDHSGKQHRTSVGRWPGTTVAVAREKAWEIIEAASEGRARDTVEEVAKLFVADAKLHIASGKTIERVLANHVLPVLGDRPIRDIDRAAVHALLNKIVADRKPGAAREVRKHMSALLNWATERGHVDANAIAGMKRRDLVAPDAGRALSGEELRAVYAAATTQGYPFGDLYRLLLLTGQRRSDWCRASWTEIEDGVLTIPAERYKSRREHLVPLSEPAQEIVDGLKRQTGDYLFSTLDGHSPVSGLSGGKRRLDRLVLAALRKDDPEATLARFRVHDFRVTVETGLASLGVIQEVRDAVLGHARPGLQKIYNRHDYLAEKRSALDAWAAEVVG